MIGYKVCTSDSYPTYKEMSETPVKYKYYSEVVVGFLKFMMDKVFEGHDVVLGAKLGFIGIRCRKVVPRIAWDGRVCGVAPSWAKTKVSWTEKAEEMGVTFKEYVATVPKEERHLVYCFNEHSNGLKYGLMWYKKDAMVMNKTFYNLVFCRAAKRRLSRAANAGVEYVEINPKVSGAVRIGKKVPEKIIDVELERLSSWEKE